MIHLDTSFLIRALVPGTSEDAKLRAWLGARTALAISAIGWAEFLCGPVGSREVELAARVVGDRVPFHSEEAELSARLFNASGRRKGSLADCMIAATALAAGARLATGNPRDFSRLTGAGLELIRPSD